MSRRSPPRSVALSYGAGTEQALSKRSANNMPCGTTKRLKSYDRGLY